MELSKKYITRFQRSTVQKPVKFIIHLAANSTSTSLSCRLPLSIFINPPSFQEHFQVGEVFIQEITRKLVTNLEVRSRMVKQSLKGIPSPSNLQNLETS